MQWLHQVFISWGVICTFPPIGPSFQICIDARIDTESIADFPYLNNIIKVAPYVTEISVKTKLRAQK